MPEPTNQVAPSGAAVKDATNAQAAKPTDDRPATCDVHNTPMVREREHIGDGNHRWSEWFCPLCREIEAKKPFDANAHLPKTDAAPKPPAAPKTV